MSTNALSRSNAPQSSWSGDSVHGLTELSRRIAARQDVPLDECGFPFHSYRYHTLSLQELEIAQIVQKIGQDFDNGTLDFNQWRILDRYWTDKERAVSKQIDEEMKTGPQNQEELLQSWGYTDSQAAQMVRHSIDVQAESCVRSHRYRHLDRRSARGD